MTILGRERQSRAISAVISTVTVTAAVLLALAAIAPHTANARSMQYPYNSEPILVQAPAWHAIQTPNVSQMVNPPEEARMSNGRLLNLWPRYIRYSPETKQITPFLQNDLRVGVRYTRQFDFNLGATDNAGKEQSIPNGYYQLQMAVVRMQGDSRTNKSETIYDRFVTSASHLVRINNGSFSKIVNLDFPTQTATTVRHHLYIQLIPLEENCEFEGPDRQLQIRPCIATRKNGQPDATRSILKPRQNLRTYLFEMPFVPFITSADKTRGIDDLVQMEAPFGQDTLAEYIAKAQLKQNQDYLARRKRVTVADYVRTHQLRRLDINGPEVAAANRLWAKNLNLAAKLTDLATRDGQSLIKLPQADKEFYTALCGLLAQQNQAYMNAGPKLGMATDLPIQSWLSRCSRNPEKHFRLSRISHVGKIAMDEVGAPIVQRSQTLGLMSNFMVSRAQSQDVFSSVNVNPAKPLFKILESIGDWIPLDYSHSVSYGNSRSKSQTALASLSSSLVYSTLVFQIPTSRTTQCLRLEALPTPGSPFFNQQKPTSNGFYLCAPTRDRATLTETFVHAVERCMDNPNMDCTEAATQSVNLSLRGEREVRAFFYSIRTLLSADVSTPAALADSSDWPSAQSFFTRTPMTENSLIVTPIEFEREAVPTFFEKLVGMYSEPF